MFEQCVNYLFSFLVVDSKGVFENFVLSNYFAACMYELFLSTQTHDRKTKTGLRKLVRVYLGLDHGLSRIASNARRAVASSLAS
jgi:hypothetical protein